MSPVTFGNPRTSGKATDKDTTQVLLQKVQPGAEASISRWEPDFSLGIGYVECSKTALTTFGVSRLRTPASVLPGNRPHVPAAAAAEIASGRADALGCCPLMFDFVFHLWQVLYYSPSQVEALRSLACCIVLLAVPQNKTSGVSSCGANMFVFDPRHFSGVFCCKMFIIFPGYLLLHEADLP